jgi:hypothetical protein
MKVFKENENFNVTGTSGSGYIKATYNQLVEALGEPTYNTPSGDNKVQKEWVVEFEGNIFTIYDWKTFDVDYTMNELDEFNVGSKVPANKFISALQEKINKNI